MNVVVESLKLVMASEIKECPDLHILHEGLLRDPRMRHPLIQELRSSYEEDKAAVLLYEGNVIGYVRALDCLPHQLQTDLGINVPVKLLHIGSAFILEEYRSHKLDKETRAELNERFGSSQLYALLRLALLTKFTPAIKSSNVTVSGTTISPSVLSAIDYCDNSLDIKSERLSILELHFSLPMITALFCNCERVPTTAVSHYPECPGPGYENFIDYNLSTPTLSSDKNPATRIFYFSEYSVAKSIDLQLRQSFGDGSKSRKLLVQTLKNNGYWAGR